jgi:trehalose 6-phosphate phosphatase
VLQAFRARASRAGVFLDFDGTLSEIVAHPDQARAAPDAGVALSTLVPRYAVVAVITGRRAEEVAALLGTQGVRYEGVYGMQGAAPDLAMALAPRVERAAEVEPSAWVEDKGASLTVHYRQAPDPVTARSRLLTSLRPLAAEFGLEVAEGKMVLELVPVDRPRKGGAVERIAGELDLQAVLFAGDDLADLDAFATLDALRERGGLAVKVAVRGNETPPPLLEAADLVVDGPGGTVKLLRELA